MLGVVQFMKTILISFMIFALTIVAHATENKIIEATIKGEAELWVSPISADYTYKEQTVEIKNVSGKDFFVSGNSLSSVFVDIYTEDATSGEWISRNNAYCGTFAKLYRVPTGSSFTVSVSLPEEISDRDFVVEFTLHSDENDHKGTEIRTKSLRMNHK